MSVDLILSAYLRWRDEKAEIEARHKEELAPIKEKMQQAEAALQKMMLDQDLSQIKKKGVGTAYLQEHTAAKVDDWDSVLSYVTENQRYDLLERRVNKTAVMDTEDEIPGITVSKSLKVNVRRA